MMQQFGNGTFQRLLHGRLDAIERIEFLADKPSLDGLAQFLGNFGRHIFAR